jgi:hypothetical protein
MSSDRIWCHGMLPIEDSVSFALVIRDLRKSFGDVIAMNGLNLEVKRGASVCLVQTAPVRPQPSKFARA